MNDVECIVVKIALLGGKNIGMLKLFKQMTNVLNVLSSKGFNSKESRRPNAMNHNLEIAR